MSGGKGGKSTGLMAVDTGGTFTDFLYLRGRELRRLKIPSTPDDPAGAVLAGAQQLTDDGGGLELLVHGSTVATNALLEGKVRPVALVTNAGFEDVVEIGRQDRPQLYALVGHRPPPPVPRELRFGISGRLGPHGEELAPLDSAELASLATRIPRDIPVAICLLHSYANPTHEEAVAQALAESHPLVSLSSHLLPEYREYERTSTTVVNAAVRPLMSGYLGRIGQDSSAGELRIMASSGIGIPVERARTEPVHTVLSGPAGGVVGARFWADRSELPRILTFDMGGTSTDVALSPGPLLHTREFQVGGHPLGIPVLDIHTVGAGGGSLARVDPGGALRVGPESAGARPGPICYRRGGTGLTVTDAHVWLGRIPPDAFLQAEGGLHREGVLEPLRLLASALGSSLEDAAAGVLAVADATMERALRVISVERGFDPRDFALVSFGGAGGLHAAELAHRISVSRVLLPPDPGLLSAFGMLVAPPARERARTVLLDSRDPNVDSELARVYQKLEAEAIHELLALGWSENDLRVERWVDARYRGQSFELAVPFPGWQDAFHDAHAHRYGFSRKDRPVEAVTLRVRAEAPAPSPELPALATASSSTPWDLLPVRLHYGGEWVEGVQVARQSLLPGHRLEGPALITEYSSTTWVPTGWVVDVMPWGSLHLEFQG